MRLSTNLIILTLLNLGTFAAAAKDLTDVYEIVAKANFAAYYAGNDGRAEARMKIVDAQGNRQVRQFTILRKDTQDQGDQDMLVFFSRPTDVKGMVFRVAKHVGKDDDRWLYLPALDLVKRVSAGDKRTAFVGAHYFYEDVSGRNPKDDNFTLLGSNASAYTLKAVPKDPNSVEFAHYIAVIDKSSFLPMTVSYFDQQGEKIREMKVLKTQLVDEIITVVHSKISQLSDGSYTEMQFRAVKYNVGLPDSIFTERSLRNPPKIWLK